MNNPTFCFQENSFENVMNHDHPLALVLDNFLSETTCAFSVCTTKVPLNKWPRQNRQTWKKLLTSMSNIYDRKIHYNDVIMGAMASQITSLTIVYPTIYSGTDQRKHHSSASLAFVRGIHRWPVNSPHKWPVTRKMFPFNDVIMQLISFPKQDAHLVYVQQKYH